MAPLLNKSVQLIITDVKNYEEDSMAQERNQHIFLDEDVLAEIKYQLANIQYGSLEIQIHNGQVVQLERREKKRWGKSENAKQPVI
jgi:hypothetical protein